MASYSKHNVVLVRFPFTDLSGAKIRPAVVVSVAHTSQDVFIVPLTSKTDRLQSGEFVMHDWHGAGLNVKSAVKRGVYTIHQDLIVKQVGSISSSDADALEQSLRSWLGL
jgi:mRNA interferase MazF